MEGNPEIEDFGNEEAVQLAAQVANYEQQQPAQEATSGQENVETTGQLTKQEEEDEDAHIRF